MSIGRKPHLWLLLLALSLEAHAQSTQYPWQVVPAQQQGPAQQGPAQQGPVQQGPTQQTPRENQDASRTTYSQLARELAGANQTASRGDLWAAADQIFRALDAIDSLPQSPIPPHFYVAVEHARNLTLALDQEVRNEVRPWPDQDQARRFGGRVRYHSYARGTEMALKAYRDHDERFFYVLPRNFCGQTQQQCPPPYFQGILPREYFEGVKNLALRFLMEERANGRLQAIDRIELIAIQATAQAARGLLRESVFRREFGCIIHRLNILDNRITELLRTRAIPWGDRTQEARALQDRAIQEFSRPACELVPVDTFQNP